jgi:ubiquinone/menaquinone biosynthesis C-methylase UbiE
MGIISKIKRYIPASVASLFDTDVRHAYDMWSSKYDEQPNNLMLALDETMFTELIANISFQNKIIADVGCGTGRHWQKIYAKQPAKVIGYDVSEGMLNILKRKHPGAETYKLETNRLARLPENSCDIIISTLAVAHIKNITDAFSEWARVLKPDGHIIITDYHPEALAKGGNRTFEHNGKQIAVRNYVHLIKKIKNIARKLDFEVVTFIEKKIDETVKAYYEEQNGLPVFERFKGTSIIYGIHLVKKNAAK